MMPKEIQWERYSATVVKWQQDRSSKEKGIHIYKDIAKFSMSFELTQRNSEVKDGKALTTAKPLYHHEKNSTRYYDNSVDYPKRIKAIPAIQSPTKPLAIGFDFAKVGIQPKVKISQPKDEYEQVADRVAEEVMHTSEPLLQHQTKMKQDKPPAQGQATDGAMYSVNVNEPSIADNMLHRAGQPLDTEVRGIMEQRFGHDFSRVRVHTDARASTSAQDLNAIAYTVGEDIVFGAGKYQPQSFLGRALISHELTHTIQQGAASLGMGNNTTLEQEADEAALNIMLDRAVEINPTTAAPLIQFLRVTEGGFGRALEEFTKDERIPERAIQLLRTSKTFMRLAQTLDRHYVARNDSARFNPEYSSDHRIKSGDTGMPGSMVGKRELKVVGGVSGGGASFEDFNFPGNRISADVIVLDSRDTPGFIQSLAHEATHAADFVGAGAPPALTLEAEIQAAVQEEIHTRQSEATILGEISDPKVRARAATVGSRDPAVVERDIPPAFMLTYKELFFFNRQLRDAQAAEGLTDEKAKEIRNEVDEAEDLGLRYPYGGEYGTVWSNRRTAKQEWEEFLKGHRQGDSDFEQLKEARLQDHARRFFQGLVSYQPLIVPTP